MRISSVHSSCLEPKWDAPANITAVFTTRVGDNSRPPFDGFNLGHHVGDQQFDCSDNRSSLSAYDGLKDIQWLDQIHGADVVKAEFGGNNITADASYSAEKGLACAVLTADCLPVLLCNNIGTELAAVHAGWRGLAKGILANAVAKFEADPSALRVCFGPCIGPCHFEVGEDVLQAFTLSEAFAGCKLQVEECFSASGDKYYADLKGLALLQLKSLGVELITSNDYCTYCDEDIFYSYRRQALTGRMASFIYRR
ncbi:MAG: YfiH family protein [Pseudomonadales bacterium]|jgi:YfiH family protein